MKKIAIMAAVLAVAACDNVNVDRDALAGKAAEVGTAAEAAAQGLLAQFRGTVDSTKTAEAKAATGETEIGATAATAETEIGAAATGDQATPTEQTVEQKVEEARRAVTTLIPAGTYGWIADGHQKPATVRTINPGGGGTDRALYSDRRGQFQLRKVGEDMCFELPEDGGIGNCFNVTGPDQSGAYVLRGTNNNMNGRYVPVE